VIVVVVVVTGYPVYSGSELVVSMRTTTTGGQLLATQYLGGWDVTKLANRTATDLFSTMIAYSSQTSYSDMDFLYSRRLVYKTVNNEIAVTSATSGKTLSTPWALA
jgi:hypothetical protein